MILTVAVIVGLTAGIVRAKLAHRPYRATELKYTGLVIVAFIPQWFAFYQPRTGFRLPSDWAPFVLVVSLVVLLIFAWLNRRQPGFWLLGAGLLSNLTVIVLNGGLMPISPEMVRRLYPQAPEASWAIGERLGGGKDIVLPVEDTRLWFLSDALTLPEWVDYSVAFSVGDVLIALGAFWLLFALGGQSNEK